MILYVLLEAFVGVLAGILIAAYTERSRDVVYGKLDRAGQIVNIFLIPIYAIAAPFCMVIGVISEAAEDGFLGVIGWILAVICASAVLFCGLGLGCSVALRKKGKSRLSFAVQFAGIVGILLTFSIYALFAGSLLSSLN